MYSRLLLFGISSFLSKAKCPASFYKRLSFIRRRRYPGSDVVPAATDTLDDNSGYIANLQKQFDKIGMLEKAKARNEWFSSIGQPMSRREVEIAALLSEGNTAGQIAEKIHIRATTAERHIANIYRKMNVHSRSAFKSVTQRGL